MRSHAVTKSILKAVGVFGGVRMLLILCALIRNKLIAVFVGPAGVGLISLYNSVREMFGTLSSLNIDQSATRDIARSPASKVDHTAGAVMRCSWVLGIAGALLMCAMSPALSLWSFGSVDLWWTYCLLSLVPLGTTIYNGVSAVFQGTRSFRKLARMSILSTLTGVIVAIPLIVFLRERSIIWVLVAYGVAAFASAMAFRPRLRHVVLNWREVWRVGRSFISLGFLITAGLLIGQLFNYFFILFLNHYASTDTLGIYQAGFTIVNAYVGVFFTGMWVEFLPRLSAQVHSPRRTSISVSHQISTTAWLLMPVIGCFVCADELIVKILYADNFMAMLPFITLGIAGVLLRAVSWCLAHVMLARGDGRIYVVSETVSGVFFLTLHIVFYRALGFLGLGIAYIIWYALYLAFVYIIYHRRYGLRVSAPAWRIVVVDTAFAAVCVLSKWYVGWWMTAILTAIIIPFSWKRLRS